MRGHVLSYRPYAGDGAIVALDGRLVRIVDEFAAAGLRGGAVVEFDCIDNGFRSVAASIRVVDTCPLIEPADARAMADLFASATARG